MHEIAITFQQPMSYNVCNTTLCFYNICPKINTPSPNVYVK